MDKSTLTIPVIVKNEEKYLKDFLEKTLPHAQRILLIDTGSTDRTLEVARSFNVEVHKFVWNGSFSDARNFSLTFCRQGWIFILDPDEELAKDDWAGIKKLIDSNKDLSYRLTTRNYTRELYGLNSMENDQRYPEYSKFQSYFPSSKVRLFQASRGYKFAGAVHEVLNSDIESKGGMIVDVPYIIHHFGYLEKKDGALKEEMYLKMGLRSLEENPDDLKVNYEVAMYYVKKLELVKAQTHLERCLAVDPHFKEARAKLGIVLLKMGKYNLAMENFQLILTSDPDNFDAVYFSGLTFMAAGNLMRAAGFLNRACELRPGFAPAYVFLVRCHEVMGRFEDAWKLVDKAKRLFPENIQLEEARKRLRKN